MTRINSAPVSLLPPDDLIPLKEQGVVLDVPEDIAEALDRLADHISWMNRDEFLCSVASLLLMTLLTEDHDGAIDGFERLVTAYNQYANTKNTQAFDRLSEDKLWGEYMSLKQRFVGWFKAHQDMKYDLEELVTGDFRAFPEEIFRIKFSSDKRHVLVR